MKIDLSRLDLDGDKKGNLTALLQQWIDHAPDLGAIPSCTLLKDLGLITLVRHTLAGPKYRGTEPLKDCVGYIYGKPGLQMWLEYHTGDPFSIEVQMGCTMWVYLGRFPRLRPRMAKWEEMQKRWLLNRSFWSGSPVGWSGHSLDPGDRDLGETERGQYLHPPVWVVKKFEKSLRDPTRERLMGIFGGPTLWSKQAVLEGLRGQTSSSSLPAYVPSIMSHSLWSGSPMGWSGSQTMRASHYVGSTIQRNFMP